MKFNYEDKGFTVRFIVDQINDLYNTTRDERVPFIENWDLLLSFTGCKPLTFVSSRNNEFLDLDEDPILYIARTKQKMKKEILDNMFTESQRLAYSYESILFELEKMGIPKGKAVDVLKQVNISSFLTRMAIR